MNCRNLLALTLVTIVMTACGPKEPGNVQTSNSEIHKAAEDGDTAKVEQLLAANPNIVNARGTDNATPLICAARMNKREVVSLLLAKNADVNAKDWKDRTPLHWAVINNSNDVAKLLLGKGAEVNARDRFGMTPLHMAYGKGMITLLLANKADINAKNHVDRTPLHLSAETEAKGARERAEVLLANKANVNARDYWGRTPLNFAIERKHAEIADLLRLHGGKLQAELGWNPFCRYNAEVLLVVAGPILALVIIAITGRFVFKHIARAKGKDRNQN